jgi:hypothetical protein
MPRRFAADKATSDKTAVSKAMPQQAPKNTRKENPNAPEKGRAVTSRTTGPSLARKKRMALSVIAFISNITSSILTGYSSFSVWSSRRRRRV